MESKDRKLAKIELGDTVLRSEIFSLVRSLFIAGEDPKIHSCQFQVDPEGRLSAVLLVNVNSSTVH